MRGRCLHIIASSLVMAAIASSVAAQSTRKPKPIIEQAIESLIAEAEQAIRTQKAPTGKPEFADRKLFEVPLLELQEALAKTQHQDPFIDAYIRWQLASFNPDFPPLSDSQFETLLEAMPRFIGNPRADQQLVEFLDELERIDPYCGTMRPFRTADIA
jgi:hypothetical protein